MADSRDTKRPRRGEPLGEMSDGRRGETTAPNPLDAGRRTTTDDFFEHLIRTVATPCANPFCCERDGRNGFKIAHIKARFCDFLARHHDRVVVFLLESREAHPLQTASTYELLEVSWYNRECACQPKRLDYFKAAQKIRDEFGFVRESSSVRCFNSLEDIARLEQQLEANEPVDFMTQCVALAECLSIGKMFRFLRSHSHLESFRQVLYRLGRLDDENEFFYSRRFETLADLGLSKPTWDELEKYLNTSFLLCGGMATLFDATIPNEKLDEAFKRTTTFLLRFFARAPSPTPFMPWRRGILTAAETDIAFRALKLLLSKGATLLFQEPPGSLQSEQSSVGALLELADMLPDFPLAEFSPYICCSLTDQDGEVKFDTSRVARLSCLAARSIKTSEELTRVPKALRPWIRMNQDLQSRLTS